MMKNISVIVASLVLFLSFGAHSAALDAGPWRFELKTANAVIPFIIQFELVEGKYSATLFNGEEKIKLNDIRIKNKNVSIPLQTYEVSLEMEQPKEGKMIGLLVRHNKNPKVKTLVRGVYKETERFPEEKSKPDIDLNGRWLVSLTDESDKTDTGIIVFKQKGNNLNGSILTPTGDYRYMEGFVSGSEFEAASFDGVYNYLVKGKVDKDGKLQAKILSNSITKIEGKKDANADLPDAYKQTQVESINFTFPNLSGKNVSLSDKKFKNKPVIIQFFGSWCPNCLDEMNYLIPWYKENKNRGIEIVALSFERSLSKEEAKKQLMKVKKKKNIPYTLLIAGHTSEDKPMDKVPGLKNFMSFPTTVFLNKKHEVVKVHAGFTGPSTGEFYDKWKTEFNQTVNEILK
jgi:thiol-disulfide isomerase/thioredoxin